MGCGDFAKGDFGNNSRDNFKPNTEPQTLLNERFTSSFSRSDLLIIIFIFGDQPTNASIPHNQGGGKKKNPPPPGFLKNQNNTLSFLALDLRPFLG